MTFDEQLDRQLFRLGSAVSPGPSVVDDVMSRIARSSVAPRRFLWVRRWSATMVQPRQLGVSATIIAVTLVAIHLLTRDWKSAVAFAQEASAALARAKVNGVTLKERFVLIMNDGSRHTSSTVSTLFLGRDSYRRDIYDGGQLREIQWYTPDGGQMVQTSVRFDKETWAVERHEGTFGEVDPVQRMQSLVQRVDEAVRHLKPLEIEGRLCTGFEIPAGKYADNSEDGVDRIWFDTATKLPVRIEHERPKAEEQFKSLILVQECFRWNPRLPADTFTPRIPEGFNK